MDTKVLKRSECLANASGLCCLHAAITFVILVLGCVGVSGADFIIGGNRIEFGDETPKQQVPEQRFLERWSSIRAKQAPGLRLDLQLPTKQFYQGQTIPVTLVFSDLLPGYHQIPQYKTERDGEQSDIHFFAESLEGEAVADPMSRVFRMPQLDEGLRVYDQQGQGLMPLALTCFHLNVVANQWLRFDRPGKYRVYACAGRVQPNRGGYARQITSEMRLVSDFVTIEITPLETATEQKILAKARTELAQEGGDLARSVVEELRHLQTPGAREILRRVLTLTNQLLRTQARYGLLAAPNQPAEAEALLTAIKQPEFGVTWDVVYVFDELKGMPRGSFVTEEELFKAVRTSLPEKQGLALFTTAFTLLKHSPRSPELRSALVQHKQFIMDEQITILARSWFNPAGSEHLGGPDLLPILRLGLQAPRANPEALSCMARAAPEETARLIAEDLASPRPRFIQDQIDSRYVLQALELLPATNVPALDDVFRARLKNPATNWPAWFPLIGRYASTNLLPEVVALYLSQEGQWGCEVVYPVLRYWIRCNPGEGVAALERALQVRQPSADGRLLNPCYRNLLPLVLQDGWVEEARPLVLRAMKDKEIGVVISAIRVLERHAPIEVFPEVLAALDRLARENLEARSRSVTLQLESIARQLAGSRYWMLTANQLSQLSAYVIQPQGKLYLQRLIQARSQMY